MSRRGIGRMSSSDLSSKMATACSSDALHQRRCSSSTAATMSMESARTSKGKRLDFYCGFPAARLVSHTYQIPNRPFIKCAQKMDEKKCAFWESKDEHVEVEAAG